ncbi:helix-turn-helix domain-containing protein [Nocardia sp. NPDC058379]|uniref:helix-turn-helix domain-containing protein n=1 Tax=unclassified Nocardia TaxID=2637762 RepID=UPI00364D123F
MTAKLDYEWHLRDLMARQGMFSTTDIRPLLIERGITLSPTQIWRLVTEKPERLNLKVLVALMDILGCRMDELVEPIAVARRSNRKAVGETSPVGNSANDAGLGSLRPKRARVVPPKP